MTESDASCAVTGRRKSMGATSASGPMNLEFTVMTAQRKQRCVPVKPHSAMFRHSSGKPERQHLAGTASSPASHKPVVQREPDGCRFPLVDFIHNIDDR